MRLAAEIRGIVEPRHAGLEPLVAALAKLDPAARLDARARNVTDLHRVAVHCQHDAAKPGVDAVQITQPAEHELGTDIPVERQLNAGAGDYNSPDGCAG